MLNEQEMAVLRHVDGSRSVTDLLGLLNSAWPQREFTRDDVEDFLAQLIQNQLVVRTSMNRATAASRSTKSATTKPESTGTVDSSDVFKGVRTGADDTGGRCNSDGVPAV